MKEKLCIIPCNGLDKALGIIAREVAIELNEREENIELICPVSLNSGNEKYNEMVKNFPIVVIDGCMTRCASKLLDFKNSQIVFRVLISDMLKKFEIKPGNELRLNNEGKKLIKKIVDFIIMELNKPKEEISKKERKFKEIEYYEIIVDKYRFRVPRSGYLFNENDCWVKPEGNTALLGITDYLQNSAGDVLFVDLPEIGKKLEQFDDIGSFESSKTVLQLISPVSGEIIAINENLYDHPELLNEEAYRKGWFVEVKLKNFDEDKEFLMDCQTYFEYIKNKAEKERELLNKNKLGEKDEQ
ncbi:MAG: glycine cleavage system protein GcvH [Candidatus Lokiarchaeota archaeon]